MRKNIRVISIINWWLNNEGFDQYLNNNFCIKIFENLTMVNLFLSKSKLIGNVYMAWKKIVQYFLFLHQTYSTFKNPQDSFFLHRSLARSRSIDLQISIHIYSIHSFIFFCWPSDIFLKKILWCLTYVYVHIMCVNCK